MNDNADAAVTESNSGEFVPLFGDWRDEVLLDSVAWALAESRKDLRKEYRDELTAAIHKLELQVAELRGELKGHAWGRARRQRRRAAALGVEAQCSLTRATACPSLWPPSFAPDVRRIDGHPELAAARAGRIAQGARGCLR